VKCPHCTNRSETMIEYVGRTANFFIYLCNVCGKTFGVKRDGDKIERGES
jgi:transposase-like protein